MKKVFIDGSAGTTGLRIVQRLSARNDIELIVLSDELRKDSEARRKALNSSDAAFLCLPDDAAREAVSMMTSTSTVILDTSTAHRTADGWAYGFPELSAKHRDAIASSKRIAVPGCHASGFVSLIYPLVEAGILPDDALVCCHSLTGYSGGGKKMIAEYEDADRPSLFDAPRQYALGQTHKHLPEMAAHTGLISKPIFSPIVADYYSGMLVCIPLFVSQINGTVEDVKAALKAKYSDGGLVQYVEGADESGLMSAGSLSGKDSMQVSVYGNEERFTLVSRFDNLGKGASGAAIQCMNIAFGLDETTGLDV